MKIKKFGDTVLLRMLKTSLFINIAVKIKPVEDY